MGGMVEAIGRRRNVSSRYVGLSHPNVEQMPGNVLSILSVTWTPFNSYDQWVFVQLHSNDCLSRIPSRLGYLEPSQHPRPCDEALHPGLCAVRIAPSSWFMWDAYFGVGEGVEGVNAGIFVETDPDDDHNA